MVRPAEIDYFGPQDLHIVVILAKGESFLRCVSYAFGTREGDPSSVAP